MDSFVRGYGRPNSNGDLFSGLATCGGAPSQSRRVITEDSDELVRIQNKSRDLNLGYMDGATSDFSAGALRSVLIKVIALAHQDIALSMKRVDPRRNVRKGPNGTEIVSENYEFRSAVHFFFQQSKVYDSENQYVGCYSAFNSYCALLDLDAPRTRRTLLDLYPGLSDVIAYYITSKEFRAPVASAGLLGGKALFEQREELFF